MARINDWMRLAQTTYRSLDMREMEGLYSVEWPEAKRALIAEHQSEIEREHRTYRKQFWTVSAILFGLAKRLTPQRRAVFILATLATALSVAALVADGVAAREPHAMIFLVAASVAMTLLLALELIDKIKLRDELQLARELQAGLIPTSLPVLEHYELGAFNQIANMVGGDIYDFVPLPDGRLAVLFGDASGHGMAAGLVMAVAHAAFRTQIDIDPSPAAVTSSLNRILCRTGGPRAFFAGAYLVLSNDGSFEAVLAGHPPLLKVDRHGATIDRIGRGAYPLGIKPSLTWELVTGSLQQGECLVLHSDGLAEARDIAGNEFGYDYVETVLGWQATEESARETLDSLVVELRSFVGRVPLEDDVSIAVIRRRK